MPDVDPLGPVFVSHRRSDGVTHAEDIAWALRAAGVPVWRDETDLRPGDTSHRLDQALASGLSGAVLIITPDIAQSGVVKDIELPTLLGLSRNPAFTLSIGSTITLAGQPDTLDFDAPARLLGPVASGLSQFKQEPIDGPRQRARLARWHAQRRIEALRPRIESNGKQLVLDVQTRVEPAPTDADLTLRLRPPLERQRSPHPDGLADLQNFLADLPQLVRLAGADSVRVRGGAHVSVAYALGATIPSTLVGSVEVLTQYHEVWTGAGPVLLPDDRLLTGEPEPGTPAARAVLVFVDLVPNSSYALYEDFREARREQFAAALHLRSASGDKLDPADAGRIVEEADRAIRGLLGTYRASDVHLLLSVPFPIAVLLGRRANTLRVHLYEDENADDGAGAPRRYLPSMIVRSGVGGSPIERVTAS